MSNEILGASQDAPSEKVRVNVANAPWEKCECGGHMFESVFLFKRVSALLSPSGKELHIPMELFRCTSCSKIPNFVSVNVPDIPESVKSEVPGISNVE